MFIANGNRLVSEGQTTMSNSQLSETTIAKTSSFYSTNIINTQPLVLIVEDDTDSRLMLRLMLETLKYQVVQAQNGSEAIEKARQLNPDLILMDVGLPDMDGFDATRQIREYAAFDSMPIIYLSGFPSSFAEDVGGNDYLVKPIDILELENILSTYIRN
jgi:CheY-like chemotaxis protein